MATTDKELEKQSTSCSTTSNSCGSTKHDQSAEEAKLQAQQKAELEAKAAKEAKPAKGGCGC